jgi:hypothetical protein
MQHAIEFRTPSNMLHELGPMTVQIEVCLMVETGAELSGIDLRMLCEVAGILLTVHGIIMPCRG